VSRVPSRVNHACIHIYMYIYIHIYMYVYNIYIDMYISTDSPFPQHLVKRIARESETESFFDLLTGKVRWPEIARTQMEEDTVKSKFVLFFTPPLFMATTVRWLVLLFFLVIRLQKHIYRALPKEPYLCCVLFQKSRVCCRRHTLQHTLPYFYRARFQKSSF